MTEGAGPVGPNRVKATPPGLFTSGRSFARLRSLACCARGLYARKGPGKSVERAANAPTRAERSPSPFRPLLFPAMLPNNLYSFIFIFAAMMLGCLLAGLDGTIVVTNESTIFPLIGVWGPSRATAGTRLTVSRFLPANHATTAGMPVIAREFNALSSISWVIVSFLLTQTGEKRGAPPRTVPPPAHSVAATCNARASHPPPPPTPSRPSPLRPRPPPPSSVPRPTSAHAAVGPPVGPLWPQDAHDLRGCYLHDLLRRLRAQ